jgi:hypothetical protein
LTDPPIKLVCTPGSPFAPFPVAGPPPIPILITYVPGVNDNNPEVDEFRFTTNGVNAGSFVFNPPAPPPPPTLPPPPPPPPNAKYITPVRAVVTVSVHGPTHL